MPPRLSQSNYLQPVDNQYNYRYCRNDGRGRVALEEEQYDRCKALNSVDQHSQNVGLEHKQCNRGSIGVSQTKVLGQHTHQNDQFDDDAELGPAFRVMGKLPGGQGTPRALGPAQKTKGTARNRAWSWQFCSIYVPSGTLDPERSMLSLRGINRPAPSMLKTALSPMWAGVPAKSCSLR